MPMWQVWGNWPDRSSGVPQVVRSSWVTPPSESGRPGCVSGGVRLGSGQATPTLVPRLEAQRSSWSQLDFCFPFYPCCRSLSLNLRPRHPLGVALELPRMSWAGQSLLDFDSHVAWPVLAGRIVGEGAPCIHMGWVSEAYSECTEGAPTPIIAHPSPPHLAPSLTMRAST